MGDPWVVMLRSLNVGGRNRLKMDDLRAMISDLGYGAVSTYVQSGNVILDGNGNDPAVVAAEIESALATERAIDTVAILRRPSELAAALDRHAFASDVDSDARSTSLHVAFCAATPTGDLTSADLERVAPDRAVVDGSEAFLHFPHGMGRTKLTGALLERRLGVPLTIRNWRTVSELVSRST